MKTLVSVALFAAITAILQAEAAAQSICSFGASNPSRVDLTQATCGATSTPASNVTSTETWTTYGHLICPGGAPQQTYESGPWQSSGTGQCIFDSYCRPTFSGLSQGSDVSGYHVVQQDVTDKNIIGYIPMSGPVCGNGGTTTNKSYKTRRQCNDSTCTFVCTLTPNDCLEGSGWPNMETCTCNYSPIIIDTDGTGLSLTDPYGGATFDINGDGATDRVAWIQDGAFLALDRDGNGTIDSGRELFGAATEQPATGAERNGFEALKLFDSVAKGGNNDGLITSADAVFTKLRLWNDANRNGTSSTEELISLEASGILEIALDYQGARKTDAHGNLFKYRAKVTDRLRRTRWAWDVYLVTLPLTVAQ